MTDPAQKAYPHLGCLGKCEQASGIYKPDIAGDHAVDHNFALVAIERHGFRLVGVPSGVRHHVIDHCLGFARDSIDDVIDTDRLRDVVDEENQPGDAGHRKQHGAGDRGNRSDRVR